MYGFYQECLSKFGQPPTETTSSTSASAFAAAIKGAGTAATAAAAAATVAGAGDVSVGNVQSSALPRPPLSTPLALPPSSSSSSSTTHCHGGHVWSLFMSVFDTLPLAAVIDGAVFCVHGGLSPALPTIESIHSLFRMTCLPDVSKLILCPFPPFLYTPLDYSALCYALLIS